MALHAQRTTVPDEVDTIPAVPITKKWREVAHAFFKFWLSRRYPPANQVGGDEEKRYAPHVRIHNSPIVSHPQYPCGTARVSRAVLLLNNDTLHKRSVEEPSRVHVLRRSDSQQSWDFAPRHCQPPFAAGHMLD
jgi:hypothetical protein